MAAVDNVIRFSYSAHGTRSIRSNASTSPIVMDVSNDNVISIASFRDAWRTVRRGKDYTLLLTRAYVNRRPDLVKRDYSFLDEWSDDANNN